MADLRFYKGLIRSFDEIPKHNSLIIHSLIGCNLKCFGCHNYDEIVTKKHKSFYTENEIINYINLNSFLFDAIIFSGGEFLMENVQKIETFLIKIRECFDGVVVINTNGTYPEKAEHLLDKALVDGLHVDMKLPYHILNPDENQEIYKGVIGISPNKKLIENILKTIEITIKHNSHYSQVRTVEYPILDDEFFKEIQNYINQLKRLYNSNIIYKLNEFVKMNDK